MKEKIASFNAELDKINLVVDKLVTKQNAQVFDKICKMCSELFDKICEFKPDELSLENIQNLIDILKRLLTVCTTLKNYKEYLIGVVQQNITDLQAAQTMKEAETPGAPVAENAEPSEVVSSVEEVRPEEVERGVVLQFPSRQEKNAA